MSPQFKPNLLVKKFNRYGGDGLFKKIITDGNKSRYTDLLQYLTAGEIPLIVYNYNLDWTLVTNKRVLIVDNKAITILLHENIKTAGLAVRAEFLNGVKSKLDFTRIRLTDNNDVEYILTVERGEPYQGLMQVMHFIATRSRS